MVTTLSNLNIAMCHAFIKDPSFMPWEDNVFDFEFDEQQVVNNENTTEKWMLNNEDTFKSEKSSKKQH